MIRLGQRALAVGKTGEGKSEALLHTFSLHTGQRLLVDAGDHYTLGPAALEEGALEADSPRDLDWRFRTIRYVPRRPGDLAEMDELYRAIYARGRVLVLADEVEEVAPVGRTPHGVKRVVKQGRKRLLTHLAATQRPYGVDPSIITEAEHVLVFRLLGVQDVSAVAPRLGMETNELARELAQLQQHSYLYAELGAEHVLRMPPLPAEKIALTRRHVVNPG